MSTPVDQSVIDARVETLTAQYAQWVGDVPETITPHRALHLAVTVGFGSLQRLGHRRGAKVTPRSVAQVAIDRGFDTAALEDLKFLAELRPSTAAKSTARWCASALRIIEKAQA